MMSLDGAQWSDVLSQGPIESAEMAPFVVAERVRDAFVRYLADHRGDEPPWMSRLTRTQQRSFRLDYALTETDLYWAIPTVPYTGIGYLMLDGGLTEATARTFGLSRLAKIAQLGKLHAPITAEVGNKNHVAYAGLFHHNRLVHSCNVRALALLMAVNNGLGELDTRTLEIAGLTHDTLTPVYGDGTKPIDPEMFDEDLHYPELLHGASWERLRDQYRIDEQLLVDTVQGRGILGTILDIADKLSYLSCDLEAYVGSCQPTRWNENLETYKEITGVIARRKYLLGVWSAVKVEGGKVFVDDASWLGDVLLLRALMFKNLYFHPGSRYVERMTATILVRHLIDIGRVRKEDLLRMTDEQMDALIYEEFGHDVDPLAVGRYVEDQRVHVFTTLDEARQREEELLNAGVPIVFIDTHPPAKSGMHLLVRSGNAVLPFAEACPKEAAEIDRVIKAAATVKLYYLDQPYEALSASLKNISDVIRGRRALCR